uniref:Peroxisomal membrane protein PEX16 n=1 Tax=Hyaloperonospora arabidopsidis (strain Emoy2) TaxID=559515 RepID=M4B4X2_HYAAE
METETTTIETDVMPDEDPRSSLKETVTTTHISTERDNSTFSSVYKAASLLAAYETLTRLIRVPLSLISHVQVLAEVVARKFGSDVGKWRLIVWVEVIKGMLLLVLLAHRRRAMLIRGGKLCFTTPSCCFDFDEVATASEPSASTEKGVDEAPNKITFEVSGLEMVYALLRRRRPQSSWTPVVVSLLVELSGLALSAAAVKPVEHEKPVCTDKAKDEIAVRKMALLFYLLRDPVFATITKPAVGKAAHVMDYVPGIGKLFRFGTSAVLDYYHQFYFYTSAS